MTRVDRQTLPRALWFFLWGAMLLLSSVQVLRCKPAFTGVIDLYLGLLLAAVAGAQLCGRLVFLCNEEVSLSRVLLIAFCAGQLLQFVRPPSPLRGVDFSAYYIAGRVAAEKPRESLYQLPLLADGRMNFNVQVPEASPWHAAASRYHVPFAAPYIYPPLLAVLMKPMAYLSFRSGYLTWTVLTILLVLAAVVLSLRISAVRLNSRVALILGVGLFSYYPLTNNLFFGQVGGLNLFLLVAGVWFLLNRRTWLSALCFAMATAIKLTPILVVPVLIFHRRWRWLFAYSTCLAALIAFSVWQGGWSAYRQFWIEVLPHISNGAPIIENLSVVAFVQEVFLGYAPVAKSPPGTIPYDAGVVSRAVAGAIYLLTLVRFCRRPREQDLVRDLVLMMLLSLVISPVTWTNHFTIAVLPCLYLWNRMPARAAFVLPLWFVLVASDFVEVAHCLVTNHLAQLVLAGLIPGLTLVVIHMALAPRDELLLTAERLEQNGMSQTLTEALSV